MLYQTHAIIHLDNIRKNLEGIRAHVGKRKILVAVKANAYGHGAVEVSKLCEEIGMDYLGIATVTEGIQLREAGIKLPILKLSHAFPEEMEAAIENELTLAVCDFANASELQKVAVRKKNKATIHIKVDTGMGRIGVSPEEAPRLIEQITANCPDLMIEGVFTHFPASDCPDQKEFTDRQVTLFSDSVEAMERALGRKFDIVSAANSAAILSHPKSWYGMVRPGILTYGFYPDPAMQKTVAVKPALSLYTKVSFLKKVTKGTSISYGRAFLAPMDGWVATFAVGYADGFNRHFSNTGRVLIKGKSYPVAGRVCMDQTMAFLGPDANGVEVGARVTLIGRDGTEEITVDEWAEKLGTITYEVTCQISPRVPRYYDSDRS